MSERRPPPDGGASKPARKSGLVSATAALATTLVAALGALALPAGAVPPAAPSVPVTDSHHGVVVADPYRNLEDVKNPQTLGWLQAQGAYAAGHLARIEGRDAMVQRLQVLAESTGDVVRAITRLPGDRIYYLLRKAGENQFKLVLRQGLAGPEQVLVDPQPLSQARGVPHAINYFSPSWDGKTLAYGLSAGGSEEASLHLLDIASGRAIGEPIPRVQDGNVHWTPDSRQLSYNQLRRLPPGTPATETYLDSTVFLLKVGQPAERARPLFGPLVNPALRLARLDVAELVFAPGSRYMLARTTDTTQPEGRLYVAPLAALDRKTIRWRQVSGFADKITDAQLRGDTLYLRSHAGAPRGRVLALTLKDPVLARARVVVAEPAAGVLTQFALGREAVYAQVQLGFNSRVWRHGAGAGGAAPGIDRAPAAAGSPGTDLAPAAAGSTYLVADPAHAYRTPWLTTSTWTEPSKVLAVAADGALADTGLRSSARPPGAPELEVTELLVPSHDGARVPLAILRRKGLPQDGSNPTLLIGYGAYGLSIEAGFDPRSIAWLERGGVLAFANVRGSGAYGDDWYRAGFKTSKANTWKDGVACARALTELRFASPATLGIMGTSAGGIFVGRAVTSAPELFAAAVFDVGTLDTVRQELTANGITNVSEFGSVKNAAEFAALLDMSTYHQIQDGTAYPAVLLIHGLNDPRVDVWHSAKAAARLQAASSSGKPVLLRLDAQAGHGVGSTAAQRYSQLADLYSFLLWQFGKVALLP